MIIDLGIKNNNVQHNRVTHYYLQKPCQSSHIIYLVRLPPLLEREEPLDERTLPPDEYPPNERVVLEDDERTAVLLDDERIVLLDERTADEEVRTGVALAERVTLVELLRTGVAVDVRVVAVVRVVDDVLSVALPKVRSPVVVTRVAEPREVVPAARDALRYSVRRAVSNARALLTLRDALRTANERSGWRDP